VCNKLVVILNICDSKSYTLCYYSLIKYSNRTVTSSQYIELIDLFHFVGFTVAIRPMQQIVRNPVRRFFHRNYVVRGKVVSPITSLLSTNASVISPDFIVKCPYKDVVIPKTSFYNHVFQHFPKYGKNIALIDGITGREYTYNEVQESVVSVASGLVRSGMQKGDVLCIVAPNSPQVCMTYFATVACGGIFSSCNSSYTADELAYQFKNSGSRYVATIPAMLPEVREAASKAGCVKKMVILGDDDGGLGEGKDMISYQSLVKDSGSRFPDNLIVDPTEDVAILPYSSGTTGLPKGVMLTHYNVVANVCQVDHDNFINFRDQNHINVCVLPFYHIYALIIIFANNLYQGTTTLILPKFEPETFLRTIQDYRCTDAPMVPPLLIFMAQHPSVEKYDITSLKRVMSAAAPLSAELCAAVKSRTSIEVIRQGYGMTELSPLSHYCPMDADNPGSVGVPVLNTVCKIIDVQSGEPLGPNCDGEVLAKGPQVSPWLLCSVHNFI